MHTYIIAEAGVNHNGDLSLAKKLVDIAVNAKVDAIKFQTFKAHKIVNKSAKKADYQIKNMQSSESQFEMLKKLELSEEDHLTLFQYCKEKQIDFLSSPFDLDSLDFLIKLGVKKIKIGSGEITNSPLLLKASQSGLPIILSTGMSLLSDIEEALGVMLFGYSKLDQKPEFNNFRKAYLNKENHKKFHSKITLLHCTTEYPAPFDEINLNVMKNLKKAFNIDIGYSDHPKGIAVPIAAVAMGARVIEKHITLDKTLPGPDHKASIEPDELLLMTKSIREIEQSLGESIKIPSVSEMKNISVARKSIIASRDIKKGDIFSEDNITIKRPGTGLSPNYYWDILGKKAKIDIQNEDFIFHSHIDE